LTVLAENDRVEKDMQPNSAPASQKDLPREPLALPQKPLEIGPSQYEAPVKQATPANSSQLRTLLSWSSPGRPFRKRKKTYFLNALLIMFAVEVILFLFAQYILMLVVVSLVFLAFALATVPPHDFHYRISTQGFTLEDYSFLWQELYDFYFTERAGQNVLVLRTKSLIPGELTITLGDIHADQVKEILLHYLPYRESVQQSFLDKSAHWLDKTFPLDS
jgi:hypothetical protein